ncbi:MAG TPA: gamma carbonic anhydrase family protein [Myxococcota bacterium]|nr:gamma carbonic anhydrase family protein [Myxococcota bacterium]
MNPLQKIDASAWVAPSALLSGAVTIGAGVSVWHNAVLRAECEEISIGRMTNIQDFVMIHVGFTAPTRIGEFCSITHHATVHGCTIEDHCLVGINAVVMDGAVIGRGSIVAGGAVVREGSVVEPGSIIAGVPAVVIAQRDSARANRLNAWVYHRNAEHTRRGEQRAWTGNEYASWIAKKREEIERDADV